MVINRTSGSASIIPELVYANVEEAIDWLTETFGFEELWRAGKHRARLTFGNGVVIVADADPRYGRDAPTRDQPQTHAVQVKVDDVDAHHARALQQGAVVLSPPTDYSYGERQYSVQDLAGHRWTFTQAIADLAPEDWGGTSAAALTRFSDISDPHSSRPAGHALRARRPLMPLSGALICRCARGPHRLRCRLGRIWQRRAFHRGDS
jgi:uncharacterized glyoxalase superfamily protein PhnB